MNEMALAGRKLTELDFARLSMLLGDIPAELAMLLNRAQIVKNRDMPSGIVTSSRAARPGRGDAADVE